MYFPRFLVGAGVTVLIVGGWIYHVTGSIWQAMGWAVFAAIILQVGYFIIVALLIYFTVSRHAETIDASSGDEGGSLPIGRDRISLWRL
jgi:exopolysaccharide production repressor protein